jgi:sphingomyelin phosphodiesterase
MKKPFTLLIAFGYFFILLVTIVIAREQQQTVLNQPEIAIQNEVFQLSDDLFEAESIVTSCSSCISLLHVIKKISYMSEAFLISTLTKACKRTKKVDDEVVL